MSDRKRNILEAAERVGFYSQDNPNLATELPFTVELFAANQTNIERFHQAGIVSSEAEGAGKSGTRSKAARAREITADLRLVARTARNIERKDKNFLNPFTLPTGNLTYQEMIERAETFIAKSPEHKAVLEKFALTTQFFAEMGTDVQGFQDSTHGQADAKRTGVGATADIEEIIEDTLDVFKDLDVALRNHYRNNPQKLAEWLTASHIRRKKRTDNEPPPDENPPAT